MAIESSYRYSVKSYSFSSEKEYGKFPTFYNADAYCNYSLTTRDADNTSVSGSTTSSSIFRTTADFSYSITSYKSYNKKFDTNASQITFSATYSYNATISNVSWPEISKSTSTTMSDDPYGHLTFPMTVASSSSSSNQRYSNNSTIKFNSYTFYTYTVDEISWSTSTARQTSVTSMTSDLNVGSTSMLTSYSYNDRNTVMYRTSYYSTYTPGNLTSSSSSYKTFYISDVGQLVSSSSTVTNQIVDSIIYSNISEYSTYTITSGNFSATLSSFIYKTNKIEPVIESTYTSLDIAETVKDKDNYTYRTTFYGTIEQLVSEVSSIVKSDTSWLNVAQIQGESHTYLDISGISLTAGTTVDRSSSFGVYGYDMIETSAGSTVTSQLNNPIFLTAPVLLSSSFITTSEIKEGPFNTSFTTSVTKTESYENRTLKDAAARVYINGYGYDTVTFINTTYDGVMGSGWDTASSSSSTINTMDYGTTARVSDMTGSSSWADVFNTYLVNNYAFSYNISSIWIYSTITSTLSEYSTVLVTQFSKSYNQGVEYTSVSYTQSSSTTALASDDRYINKNAISRYDTNVISYTNTVAYYNGQTMATLSQSSMTTTYSSRTSTSRLTYTFISDKKDFSSSQSVITTDTMSSARQKFINSISSVVNSTSEQQNDTLIFQSTVATISTYNISSSYSTVSTMQIDYNATTYASEYNPATYSMSSTKVSTSIDVGTTISSTSGTVQVTQSIGYTPVYSTVDGIYVTSN